MRNCPLPIRTPDYVMKIIWDVLGGRISNMVDLGCGAGAVINFFDRKGIEAYGVELDCRYCKGEKRKRCDLTNFESIPLDYDLVYFYRPIFDGEEFEKYVHENSKYFVACYKPQYIPDKVIYHKNDVMIVKGKNLLDNKL